MFLAMELLVWLRIIMGTEAAFLLPWDGTSGSMHFWPEKPWERRLECIDNDWTDSRHLGLRRELSL